MECHFFPNEGEKADMINKIIDLKKKKNAAIFAHYYQDMEIQSIADVIGDSHELARKAADVDCDIIVLCGVSFMAESAKILNPAKKVLHPEPSAGCPMADMITAEIIEKMKAEYPDAAVVCYVNSSAGTKAVCDICCTSSNAVRVVKSLPNKQIIFVPDKNLGTYVAGQIPEKEFVFFDGGCPIHKNLTADVVKKAKSEHPNAPFAVHPECAAEIVAMADFVGSTSQILDFVDASDAKEFLIGTEVGVVDRLNSLYTNKKAYLVSPTLVCEDMKKITLRSVLNVLENESNEVTMTADAIEKAHLPLVRMIQV
jgi:quinolinate synthetase complex, A subunit